MERTRRLILCVLCEITQTDMHTYSGTQTHSCTYSKIRKHTHTHMKTHTHTHTHTCLHTHSPCSVGCRINTLLCYTNYWRELCRYFNCMSLLKTVFNLVEMS